MKLNNNCLTHKSLYYHDFEALGIRYKIEYL